MDREKIEEIIEYFTTMHPKLIDQMVGDYRGKSVPCCVGAHLAHLLVNKCDYMEGAKEWCKVIKGNLAQAVLLLRNAGAGSDPFGPMRWHDDPQTVFKKILRIENLPSISNEKFKGEYLKDLDLSSQVVYNTVFSGCSLMRSNFSDSSMYNIDFTSSNLDNSNFKNAYFEEVDFSYSFGHCGNLAGAFFYNCDFKNAYFLELSAQTAFGTIFVNCKNLPLNLIKYLPDSAIVMSKARGRK